MADDAFFRKQVIDELGKDLIKIGQELQLDNATQVPSAYTDQKLVAVCRSLQNRTNIAILNAVTRIIAERERKD